jgi:rod shape determining protein RodA
MPFYRMLRDLDWVMMGITLAISLVGVLQIYSATHETVLRDLWWKQLVWVFIGIVLVWLMSVVDYHGLLGQVRYYMGSLWLRWRPQSF